LESEMRYFYRGMTAALPIFLCALANGASALPSQTDTVKALKHYLSQNDPQIRALLEYENIDLCGRLNPVSAAPALTPAAGFARIESINDASQQQEWDDWRELFDAAAALADAPIERNDLLDNRMKSEEYCDKYFQRIGDKPLYKQCQFRYAATEMLFAADQAICKRDAEALGLPDKVDSQIYACMRLSGWKSATDWKENISIPVKP